MKRLNIVLPKSTLDILDGISKRGGKQSLREQLKAGYEANADESLEIALDWLAVEEKERQASPRTQRGRK